MKKKPDILFIYQEKSSFVLEDLRITGRIARVKEFRFALPANNNFLWKLFHLASTFFRQTLWLLIHIYRARLVYVWFADYHAFLPTLLARITGKPVVTVIGGFDAIRMPSLNYGVYTSRWRRPLARYVIKKCTLLLPVDSTLIRTHTVSHLWPEAHPNGIDENVTGFRAPHVTVPTGYDPEVWTLGTGKRGRTVCTVASCDSLRTARRKGIDIMIETARLMPDVAFSVVGIPEQLQIDIKEQFNPSGNVSFSGPIPRHELNKVYGATSVYIQLSRAEGLPNVLCEAMMCGCIPVGSAVFGIPTGIGQAGFIAQKPNPEHIALLIDKAMASSDSRRAEARQHIIDNFSLDRRRYTLETQLEELMAM